jgi:subtilisin-like proprotein convertase family protein
VQATATDSHDTDPFDGQGVAGVGVATYIVDNTPPTLTLSIPTSVNLSDGLIGPYETNLGGFTGDNRLPGRVAVCDTSSGIEACEEADLFYEPLETTYQYDDRPTAAVPLGATTSCGGSELLRTFVVSDSFTIADLDVGLNLTHAYRNDIEVRLRAPSGKQVTLLSFGPDGQNMDVLIDDAAELRWILDMDAGNHDVGEPYYENVRGTGVRLADLHGTLAEFNGENAQGTWELTICDNYAAEDDGAYNHSRLIFEAEHLPSATTGEWDYALTLPDATEGITQSIAIYSWDSVGNRLVNPIERTFAIDTLAPRITQTQVITDVGENDVYPVNLAGEVVDVNPVSLAVIVTGLDGESRSAAAEISGNTWSYNDLITATVVVTETSIVTDSNGITSTVETTRTVVSTVNQLFSTGAGTYEYWLEAFDAAGNRTLLGPFTLAQVADSAVPTAISFSGADALATMSEVWLPYAVLWLLLILGGVWLNQKQRYSRRKR